MSFSYRIVVSPWAQELLYRKMVEEGESTLHKWLVRAFTEATESPAVVNRAIELALELQEQKLGQTAHH